MKRAKNLKSVSSLLNAEALPSFYAENNQVETERFLWCRLVLDLQLTNCIIHTSRAYNAVQHTVNLRPPVILCYNYNLYRAFLPDESIRCVSDCGTTDHCSSYGSLICTSETLLWCNRFVTVLPEEFSFYTCCEYD